MTLLDGEDILPINPRERAPAPFVYLEMHAYDLLRLANRSSTNEYLRRKPTCVLSFDRSGIKLRISNAGLVASDLVWLDYQIIFCTARAHQPHEGFSVTHAGEQRPDDIEAAATLAVVPSKGDVERRIAFPQLRLPVVNIYFRARVATLWTPRTKAETWDVLRDYAVTEAHCRL